MSLPKTILWGQVQFGHGSGNSDTYQTLELSTKKSILLSLFVLSLLQLNKRIEIKIKIKFLISSLCLFSCVKTVFAKQPGTLGVQIFFPGWQISMADASFCAYPEAQIWLWFIWLSWLSGFHNQNNQLNHENQSLSRHVGSSDKLRCKRKTINPSLPLSLKRGADRASFSEALKVTRYVYNSKRIVLYYQCARVLFNSKIKPISRRVSRDYSWNCVCK